MAGEFNKIISQYGHDIVLQRKNLGDKNQIEYSDELEIHTVRHATHASRALPNVQKELFEGIRNTSDRIYYFRSEAIPFEGDRIYELDPRTKDGLQIFEVDQALALRGLNGDIDYYVVGVTRYRPN